MVAQPPSRVRAPSQPPTLMNYALPKVPAIPSDSYLFLRPISGLSELENTPTLHSL
jgi:hypothetical protein